NGAMCVFFSGEEPEIVAWAASGNGDRRRNSAYALSAKRIRYHDAGLAARRSTAHSHRHTTHHAIHGKVVTMDDVRITTGSTDDNAEHLSANFLKKLRELYEGTRLGRSGATRRDDPRPHARAVQGRLADP